MRILQINSTNRIGSTGKIMYDLNKIIVDNGHEGYMACAYQNGAIDNSYVMQKRNEQFESRKNILISRVTGKMGYRHTAETKKLIEWIEKIRPDIVHLHNVHGDWINVGVLMTYLKKENYPIVWTLHDCWSFTGRCSHFELCRCEKWKTGCYSCTNNKVYPYTYFFDFSEKMWKQKKEWFTGFSNMTIVTPSAWLAEYVKQSFLKGYDIRVINNGINTNVYKPVVHGSELLRDLKEYFIVLGVANSWSNLKGLADFIDLDKLLDCRRYKIVLVGLNGRQIKKLPKTIVGINRTNNEQELVELYTRANVFVNLTYQDNYPTTNLEATACGTPVITYDTGGSPESVQNKDWIIKPGDIMQVKREIEKIDNSGINYKDEMRRFAVDNFDKNIKLQQYVSLYNEILTSKNS